jgi:hypothetical protein
VRRLGWVLAVTLLAPPLSAVAAGHSQSNPNSTAKSDRSGDETATPDARRVPAPLHEWGWRDDFDVFLLAFLGIVLLGILFFLERRHSPSLSPEDPTVAMQPGRTTGSCPHCGTPIHRWSLACLKCRQVTRPWPLYVFMAGTLTFAWGLITPDAGWEIPAGIAGLFTLGWFVLAYAGRRPDT